MEKDIQKRWESDRVFEANGLKSNRDKFFVTFPYPYMNGQLHIGHAFSLSKAEVSNGFEMLVMFTLLSRSVLGSFRPVFSG